MSLEGGGFPFTRFLKGKVEEDEVKRMHPLKLAFVGDAVFEYYVRTYLVVSKNLNTHKLAMLSSTYVRASAQNRGLMALKPFLTEEEWDVVLRGRNQNPKTVPKNASVRDYRYATGFEALIGYLALLERYDRLEELVWMFIESEECDGGESQMGIEEEKI